VSQLSEQLTGLAARHYLPQVPRYGLIDSDYAGRLRSPSVDGPFYMLNLTRYKPQAEFHRSAERRSNAGPEAHYAPVGVLGAIGAKLCFVADAVASTGDWDRVSVVGYPSRHAFVEMADRSDFQRWHLQNSEGIAELLVLGLLPAAQLPDEASTYRMLLEIWHGDPSVPLAAGSASLFGVEGTIVGDGRRWTGVRFTVIEAGTALPLPDGRPSYQALLLEPLLERWR
jgi:hypothetical protein